METNHTQDLHDLVTLEPNTETYNTAAQAQPQQEPSNTTSWSASPRPSSRHVSVPVFTHSSSIFSPGLPERSPSPDHSASSSTLPSRPRLPFMSLDSAAEPSTAARWPRPPASSRLGLTRKAPIQRAEKDSDDVDFSLARPRRSLQATDSSNTSTTLNRLFAAGSKSRTSPDASREHSYQCKPPGGFGYMRSLSSETASLPTHLHQRGLIEGRHSDISVKVFGNTYALHRIILDRAPFFASALSEPWAEANQKEIELHPEDVDSTITKRTFELALKRLYGCQNSVEEDAAAVGLFATGCWLEMQDLVDASVDSILRRMHAHTVAPMLHLVTSNYYGKAGDKILASAKAVISRNGWQMPLRFWDGISSDLIHELVAGDGFFVHGEWERWLLAKRLLDRRLKAVARAAELWDHGPLTVPDALKAQAIRCGTTAAPESSDGKSTANDLQRWLDLYVLSDIEPLLCLLDEGIHYMHMDFEQLQSIRSARDALGVPLLPGKIIADALWAGLELRQRVLNACDKELTLGLSQVTDTSVLDSAFACPSSPSSKQRSGAHELRSTESLLTLGNNPTDSRRFWIPDADCNIVLGGNPESVITSMSNANRQASRLSSALQAEEGLPWFHDTPSDRTGDTAQPESRPTAYSSFPPFRFSAEFPNPRVLKERKRVYSRTVFYAGSLWNVYIQKVRSGSKNPQLGVYLHRAKERDPEGAVSAVPASVDERIGALEREILMRRDPKSFRQRTRVLRPDADQTGQGAEMDDLSSGADGELSHPSASRRPGLSTFMAGSSSRRRQRSRPNPSVPPAANAAFTSSNSDPNPDSTTPYLSSETGSSNDSDEFYSSDEAFDLYNEPALHTRTTASSTLPPYIDARPTIKTYFKIFSPSKGGRMMSVYESAPDNFNFSQSWGWKSSSLMLEDDLDADGRPFSAGRDGLSTALRGEDGEDDASGVLAAGLVGADAEGIVGGGSFDDVGPPSRANLRFMVVLGVV